MFGCFPPFARCRPRVQQHISACQQVVEQLGHTYHLLSSLTNAQDQADLHGMIHISNNTIHEYLADAQIRLHNASEKQRATFGFGDPSGPRRTPSGGALAAAAAVGLSSSPTIPKGLPSFYVAHKEAVQGRPSTILSAVHFAMPFAMPSATRSCPVSNQVRCCCPSSPVVPRSATRWSILR